jgi:hypothetical protein
MAEANHRLAQSPTIRITTASHVLAQLRARNAVKRELQKQGLKVSHYAAREISSWAQVYLDDHPQLLDEARPVVEAWIAQGVFGKRAQRALCANLSSDAQTAEPHKSTTSTVQNSGAK